MNKVIEVSANGDFSLDLSSPMAVLRDLTRSLILITRPSVN